MTVSPILEVEKLSHSFGVGAQTKQVLREVSIGFSAGEIVIIMGPSGSGKTTFLSLAGALRHVQSGSIRINQVDLATLPRAELVGIRREIGFIFQSHNLIESLTACENVQLPLQLDPRQSPQSSRARALHLLQLVGLADQAHKKPSQLSGGQCQRVAIARALALQPGIILADEPTASLDARTGHEIVEILQTLAKQFSTTILIVTHDHRILDIADRVILLEDGRMEELETRLENLLQAIADLFARIQISQPLAGNPSGFQVEASTLEHRINALSHLKTRALTSRRVDLLHQFLGTVRLLQESISAFSTLAATPPPVLSPLSDRFIQALDLLLMTAASAIQERDASEIEALETLTSDRKESMARLRESYFEAQKNLGQDDRVFLFDLTNIFSRATYFLNNVARHLREW